MDHRATIKGLEARRKRMDQSYSDWEPHFRELREYIEPSLGRFELSERRDDSTINKKIIDGTARRGLRTLTSGLMAGMTSPSRPWFRIGVVDQGLNDDPEVKAWAHTVQSRMYDVLRQSNAYRMLNTCYHNLGIYGTFGGLIVGDFENVIRCFALPMGRFRIADGESGRVEHLHRDIKMTVASAAAKFGKENLSPEMQRAFDANRIHDEVVICHAIERRLERDPLSPLSVNKPFASYYWEKGKSTLLQASGFGANPILAPRWQSVDGEVWSVSSPGMHALGDAIQLQGQHRDKAIAVQKSYDPPLVGNQSFGQGGIYHNVPGGISSVTTNDLRSGGLRPVYEVKPDVNALREDIYETQRRIDEAFFVDLFLLTSNSDRRQVTAREIAERHEEKLLVLGPVLEALDHDLLQPLIQATFHYMQEAEILPDPPDGIVETPIKIEYISALAQAQKAVGVAPIERVIGFAGAVEGLAPGAMDNIDGDAAVREFSEQVGVFPGMIKDAKIVEANRKAAAEAAQAAEMMQNAAPIAQAASTIADLSDRGAEGLQKGAPL